MDSGDYKLRRLQPIEASLIPYITLQQLIDSLNRNSISIFVYLLNKYMANNEQEFYTTFYDLKKYVGLCTTVARNNSVIENILKTLAQLGIVKYTISGNDIIIHTVSNLIKAR